MSHAGVIRPLVVIVALVAGASLMSCDKSNVSNVSNQSVPAALNLIAPDTDTVHVNFTCGAADSIGLFAPNGTSAWAIQRHPNNQIMWVVGPTVTINSITGKTDPLPIDQDAGDPHGGSPGTPFKARVKSNPGVPPGQQKIFSYAISVTCHPGQPDSIRLVLDPEMIIRKP